LELSGSFGNHRDHEGLPVKLLFAIKSLNVVGGGAERVLVDVANGMAARGHVVHILTFDSPGESFYPLSHLVARIDIAIGQPGKPTSRTVFARSIRKIRQIVQSLATDLVIPFMHSTYVPLVLALVGTRTKIIVSEHVDNTHYRSRPIQRLLVQLVDHMVLAKTVPSLALQDAHSAGMRNRVHVMRNAVDLDAFSSAHQIPPVLPPVLLSIGRLWQEKNHIDLIRAFDRVATNFPEWNLKIVGEGELRSPLLDEVHQLQLVDRVVIAGATRNVAAEYAGASIVVLPSLYESFGLVAAEALASGRPVLSFDNCLGIAEMVKSGHNGLLVKGGASSEERVGNLAKGLAQMMADPALRDRLGQAGPASVQRYALASVLDTWEEFLLKTLATAKQPCTKKS
jgi:GalNAc-alpha-(1->4)-GalNAc-alpha-(1->3)-diNAcBac-PP-undecaprenol alpha-1,4-N-acetyl-D-galactosaminyltransferase